MKDSIRNELINLVGEENILVNEPMKKHTTFHVGGPAAYFVTPQISQVKSILEFANMQQIPLAVVGNGSNLLVCDEGFDGIVLAFTKNASEIRTAESADGLLITAQAGAMLGTVAAKAAQEGFSGLEFAAGIPGTIGGAVMMNAGAYGGEIKDVLQKALIYTPDGIVREYTKDELDLSYRHSVLKDIGGIVLEATFLLQKGNREEILSKMNDYKERRIQKQPLEYPSAGSTFKRPEGHFAGKLIMDAGLSGFSVGDARVSEKHCGFVINAGNASAADILHLIEEVTKRVEEQSGVHLEPEVRMLGKEGWQ